MRRPKTMMKRKIGCLPVVDGDQLVGILTEGDFLAMLSGSGQLQKGGHGGPG